MAKDPDACERDEGRGQSGEPGTGRRAPKGPLDGIRVLEFAGIGPAPFACMLLSDLGADVVRLLRPGASAPEAADVVARGRTCAHVDLKSEVGRQAAWALTERADVLVEGFRPGVMERLGFGPEAVAHRNPSLVYARMTGWGQDGPLAQAAGHDINYIAITGALDAIRSRDGLPVPPLNLVGDYGGGSLYLVTGILAALLERGRSGRGQTIDAAITDGVASLMSFHVARAARPQRSGLLALSVLDGSAPFYGVYATADARHVAVGALEPGFFAELCRRVGLPADLHQVQQDVTQWPRLRDALATAFRQRPQAEWTALLQGTNACFAPVVSLAEAPLHPHAVARGAYVTVQGVAHPQPAPRFSRTAAAIQDPPYRPVQPPAAVLERWIPRSAG